MTHKQINTIISLFHAWIPEGNVSRHDIYSVNHKAVKGGYIVQPDICNESVEWWLDEQQFNPNTTFYRRWKDVTEKSRMELLLDQLIHYASTYGTDYSAETYCPNGDPIAMDYKMYTVIEACTPYELFERIYAMLQLGIALKSDIVEALCEYIIEYEFDDQLNIDNIANREAQVILGTRLGLYPRDPEGLMRLIFYVVTQRSMLIQDKASLAIMRLNANRFLMNVLTDDHLKSLARVFNRYKQLFMALKANPINKPIVNKISKLSKKYHEPFCPGYWESLTNLECVDWAVFDYKVKQLTNPFKIVKLLEMIKLRKILAEEKVERAFIIRNGKVWVDHDTLVPYPTDFETMAEKLIVRLLELIHVNPVKVEDADGFRKLRIALPPCVLMCPSSEKKFVGNLPLGSYYELADENNVIGIYWRNEWGTHDFDLSLIDHYGRKIGWNADYYSPCDDEDEGHDVVFSGDMTNADPEAAEVLLIRRNTPEGTIYVNRYNGTEGSKYKLFFGQDECSGFKKNYMVDPNSIVLEDMLVSEKREQIVGQIYDNKIYFMDLGMSDLTVSRAENTKFINVLCRAHIQLEPLLVAAGYEIVTDPKIADIDLSVPSKEKLLAIFMKK